MRAWQMIICETPHFASHFCLFSATFGWFLPYFPVFLTFLHALQPFICQFCPLAERFGKVAWQQSSLVGQNYGTWPPPNKKKFWQETIEFWQDYVASPTSKMTQIRLWPSP